MKAKWEGTFQKVGTDETKVFTLDLEGHSLDEMVNVIRDFVDCKRDRGWALIENRTTEIRQD